MENSTPEYKNMQLNMKIDQLLSASGNMEGTYSLLQTCADSIKVKPNSDHGSTSNGEIYITDSYKYDLIDTMSVLSKIKIENPNAPYVNVDVDTLKKLKSSFEKLKSHYSVFNKVSHNVRECSFIWWLVPPLGIWDVFTRIFAAMVKPKEGSYEGKIETLINWADQGIQKLNEDNNINNNVMRNGS